MAFAVVMLHAAPAWALDPQDRINDYSLTSWGEDAGPFPFGIYAIAQDQEGYLWLGARTGLFRFDGTTFKKWVGSAPLPDDRVSAIVAGRDGSLWLGFGTIGGVTRIRQGQVTNYAALDGIAFGDVNDLVEDDDGAIWVAAYGGLARFADGRWARVGASQGLPDAPVFTVMHDSRNTFWVGTSLGVYRRGHAEALFQRVAPSLVLGFAEDPNGSVWISDREKGFALLEQASHRPDASARGGASGRWMRSDAAGSLWVSTRGSGLWRVRSTSSATAPSVERLTRREGLPSNEIHCLFEDRHGTLWIGTRMGLSRLQASNVRATLVGDALVTSVTRSVDGSVWIGTSEGVRRRIGNVERSYGVEHGLPSLRVTSLYEDLSGTMWVATSQGVVRFANERFVPIADAQKMRLESVWSMTSDRTGVLWLCDQVAGLVHWKDGQLTPFDKALAREGAPHVAYADSEDRVWVGLWTTGVTVYTHQGATRYSVKDGLPPGTVNVFHQDRRGTIWVGTSHGLGRFDNNRFVTFDAQGFPQSSIMSIAEDEQGYLWLGSTQGLVRVSLDELTSNPSARVRYKLYGSEEGVPGTLGRPGMPSSTREANGRLWFVTSVGLAVVVPGNLHETLAPAPVRIENIVADGNTMPLQPGLRLPPRTSRIQIDYSILSLAAVGKPQFRYRLENFDTDWQDAGERRQASYTNLPPGAYTFRVASSNAGVDWTKMGDTLAFSIQPAFYQTVTFRLAVLAAIVLAMGAAWQLRLRSVRRRFNLVLAERMRVGREIHDTLLQSLVGVALEFDDISEQLDPSQKALRTQVQRIREHVERYVREARHSIWNLRSPMLETNDLSAALRAAGQAAVSSSPMQLNFEVTGTPRRAASRIEEEFLRVGQEAVHNAVRHSHGSMVDIRLSYDDGRVRLRVSDDGRGFDPSETSHDSEGHWGVTSMRERAQQIGAEFELVSSPGGGTAVEIAAKLTPPAGER